MIKNNLLILFFLFILLSKGNCDSTTTSNVLKFNPVELLNNFGYRSGTLQFSYERSIFNKFSINQDIGYVFFHDTKPSLFMLQLEELSGYSFETELRRYFLNQKINSGMYKGISIFYKYLEAKDTNYWPDEKYTIYRYEVASHYKIGYQRINQNGFTHDYSIGFGLRRISSRNNSKRPDANSGFELPYYKSFNKGSKIFLSITLAIRFGFEL